MENLPQYIENQLFKVLNCEISVKEFELWVYQTSDLEKELSEQHYLDLIAFNYNQEHAFHELYNMFTEWIDFPKFEKYRLVFLFDLIIEKDDKWIKSVKNLSNDYFEIYGFLNVFCALDDMIDYYKKTYGNNPNLIDDMYNVSKDEAIKMKNWLILGTIVIKGREGHRKGTNYIDNRT
jgi:hypothetical protein